MSSSRAPRPRHHGLTIVEVMLGLTISALLFMAVGVAFKASASSLGTNADYLNAMQTARVVLQNMSDAIRRSNSCDVGSGAAAKASTDATNVVYLNPVDLSTGTVGGRCAYVYDATAKELLLDNDPPAAPIDATKIASIRSRLGTSVTSIAKNIDSISFKGEYDDRPSDAFGVDETRLVNVQITMQVTVGKQTRQLCESVVPRRTLQVR